MEPRHNHNNVSYLEDDLKSYYIVVSLSVVPLVVIFNGLLIALVCIFRRLQDEQNILMATIAFFDMMFGLIVTPLYTIHFSRFDNFNENETGCIWMFSVIILITTGRCYFLQFLTADRYLAVVHPFWYHEHVRCGNVYRYVTGVLIVYMLLAGLLPIMGVNSYTYGNCGFYTIWPAWFLHTFFVTAEVLTAVIPTILNILIFRTVRKQQRIISQLVKIMPSQNSTKRQNNDVHGAKFKTKSRSVYTSMIVYAEYIVFYVPVLISTLARAHYLQANSDDPYYVEPDHILIFDYLATMWFWALLPTIYPFTLIGIKKDYQKAIDLLVTTPIWKWRDLRYDKLGHEFSTNFVAGAPSQFLSNNSMTTETKKAKSSLEIEEYYRLSKVSHNYSEKRDDGNDDASSSFTRSTECSIDLPVEYSLKAGDDGDDDLSSQITLRPSTISSNFSFLGYSTNISSIGQ